tara:strand:- start:82 stop:513 length:432 start_codon:yes stop_codon:yes gene_type:complete
MAYHFEITLNQEVIDADQESWSHLDEEHKDRFLSEYGKVKKSDVDKLLRDGVFISRESVKFTGSIYELWIKGKKVSSEEFIEEVENVTEANDLAYQRKWAYIPVATGVTGFHKTYKKVRRDRLNHINSKNCKCTECHVAREAA